MMEYQCLIRFGKNTLKVTFTGGSMNAIGVTPATFTTNSFIIQQAIENSNEFKCGRIHVVNVIELEEELRIERPAPAPAVAEKQEAPRVLFPGKDETPDSEQDDDNAVVKDSSGAQETAAASQPEKQESVAAMTQVEFSCNDDAKDYLEHTFGYIRSKLHNREDIINAGKAHNVEIIFV